MMLLNQEKEKKTFLNWESLKSAHPFPFLFVFYFVHCSHVQPSLIYFLHDHISEFDIITVLDFSRVGCACQKRFDISWEWEIGGECIDRADGEGWVRSAASTDG